MCRVWRLQLEILLFHNYQLRFVLFPSMNISRKELLQGHKRKNEIADEIKEDQGKQRGPFQEFKESR